MAVLILVAAALLGLALAGGASGFSVGTTAAALAPLSVSARWAQIKNVISSRPLNGMDVRCVYLMADMENGFSVGMFTPIFQATNSLFNRHQGEGEVGVPNSDGVWTGEIYYASPADPDLRVYSSLEDSVDDFVQLMGLGLYSRALAAARAGDVHAFIAAVAAVPYSAQQNYQAALSSRASRLGIA